MTSEVTGTAVFLATEAAPTVEAATTPVATLAVGDVSVEGCGWKVRKVILVSPNDVKKHIAVWKKIKQYVDE